jgi:integrase
MPKTDHRVTLTPTKIAGLKPARKGKRYWVADAIAPAFGVMVTDTGHKTFILRLRYPGQSSANRREIGDCAVMTLTDARDKAKHWRELVAMGIDPADQERRARDDAILRRKMTCAAVFEDFVRDKLSTERRGREAERDLRRDLLTAFAALPIAEITDAMVASLVKAKGRSGKVAGRNLLAMVKRFFRWAMAQPEYGLKASPCANLTAGSLLGDMPRSKARILSDDEMFALMRASSRMQYPHGPVYQILCLTALRLNEVADASWDEINIREGVWLIPASRMKGKDSGKRLARAHAVPLTKEILAVIEELPRFKNGKFLFSTTAGQTPVWMGSSVKSRLDARMLRTLKALARKRGEDPAQVRLAPFVNHDIRRTVRSGLSRLKISEEAREAVLAHARPGIRGVYDHHDYLDEKREALELWAARLLQIVEPARDNVVKLYATG